MTEQRRVNSACHFSFVFTCRRSAEDSSSDGERCLDSDRRRDAEQIDLLEGVRWRIMGAVCDCSPRENTNLISSERPETALELPQR